MRVICINEDAYPDNLPEGDDGMIKDGNIYTVIDVFFDEGYIWYVLEEDVGDGGYWENCFQRLSDINETQFIREYKTETATT